MQESKTIADRNATLTLADLIEEFVRTPEDVRIFRRTGWINGIMRQLIGARCDAGLTQAQLGERMGKQQSAIARLERGDDLKLSTLFDYLAALDLVPAGQIPTTRRLQETDTKSESESSLSDAPSTDSGTNVTAVLAAD